jgi:valyl-tRNA synthetase
LRISPLGGDVRFDEAQIEEGRNFANKIYNACRFRQMAGGERNTVLPPLALLRPYHIDIMAKLDALSVQLGESYAEYRFGEIAQKMHEFLWSEFCDWFLEAVKGDLRQQAAEVERERTLAVFDAVMSRFLQLLHPYMPHVTEELSARMGYVVEGSFLMNQPLPEQSLLHGFAAATSCQRAGDVYEAAGRLRNLKAEYQLATRRDVTFVVKSAVPWLGEELDVLALLAGAAVIRMDDDFAASKGTPAAITPVGEVYLPLEGLIDVEAERLRLSREIEKLSKEVVKCEAKLGNASFVDRAPPEVVVQEKARLEEWQGKLAQLAEMLSALN